MKPAKLDALSAESMIQQCEDAAQVLKALAHPRRLEILCRLATGEKTVSELEELSGASQSAVSQFLGRMKAEGLLDSRREGSFVHYSISDLKVSQLIRAMHEIFCTEKPKNKKGKVIP